MVSPIFQHYTTLHSASGNPDCLWTHESKLIVCPDAQVIGGGPDPVEREKAGAYLALTRTRPNPFRVPVEQTYTEL